jgi:hypothetical protein
MTCFDLAVSERTVEPFYSEKAMIVQEDGFDDHGPD